jgi:hypothetical protein
LKKTADGMDMDGSAAFAKVRPPFPSSFPAFLTLLFLQHCIDQSIRNLGSAPDIWLLHRIDKNTPIEESVQAMEDARKEGMCKFIGLSAVRFSSYLFTLASSSNCGRSGFSGNDETDFFLFFPPPQMSASTLRRAAKVAKIDFVEMEFSPFETEIEVRFSPLLRSSNQR